MAKLIGLFFIIAVVLLFYSMVTISFGEYMEDR